MSKKNNKNKSGSMTKVSKAPAAQGTKTKPAKPPNVTYKNDGSCVISHNEYIGDIDAIEGSAKRTFPLNPQSPATFTWLSAVATRFEMFRFRRLSFHYKPSCSTSNEGYVVLGFDFDAYDSFPSKVVMLAWKYSTKSAVWQECSLNASTDARLSTFRYCGIGTNGDMRLDLLGNLFVLAQSSTAISIGEVYVNYEVEFRQPSYKLPPAISSRVIIDGTGTMPSITDWFPRALVQGVNVFGNALLKKIDNDTLQLSVPGKYLLNLLVEATGSLTGVPVITASTPADSPSSEFLYQVLDDKTSSTKASYSSYLDLLTAPVNLTFSGLTNGADIKPAFLLSTYFATDL